MKISEGKLREREECIHIVEARMDHLMQPTKLGHPEEVIKENEAAVHSS